MAKSLMTLYESSKRVFMEEHEEHEVPTWNVGCFIGMLNKLVGGNFATPIRKSTFFKLLRNCEFDDVTEELIKRVWKIS